MTARLRPIHWAVLIQTMGAALFLWACQARLPDEEPGKPVETQDLYALAEREYRAGNPDAAYRNYSLYVHQNPRGTRFCPHLYYRIATLALAGHDPDSAAVAAKALVRSTSEQPWVSKGRALLEEIEGRRTPRQGLMGCLLPLSGPWALSGQEAWKGIRLALAVQPPDGRRLELIVKDTGTQSRRMSDLVEELVLRERVMGIIGPVEGVSALDAAEKAQHLNVPILCLSQDERITAKGPMVFHNLLRPSEEIKAIVKWAMRELGIIRFGVLYPDNGYGRFFMNLFWDRVEEMGGIITGVESYQPDDVRLAAPVRKMVGIHSPSAFPTQAVRADFDAVFIPDGCEKTALLATQFALQRVRPVLFLGTSLWHSPKLVELAGAYLEGAILPTGFFPEDASEEMDSFLKRYRESYGSEPGMLAAIGYDTARLLLGVMERGPFEKREDFRQALLTSKGIRGVTGKMLFGQRRETARQPFLVTISGNGFKALH